jgi:hypothetical protein
VASIKASRGLSGIVAHATVPTEAPAALAAFMAGTLGKIVLTIT